LSSALAETSRRERHLACELMGRRHDLDLHYGLLSTQLALALAGRDRDKVLALLVDQLAQAQS
jgi:UTP--glucose-1-phosphate uridylyltransferase